MHTDILLNDFAIRSFRDMTDGDYVVARMAYRARFPPQFMWSALQAVEKYLKCMLVLNRVKATGLGHDLHKALSRVEARLPFKIKLSDKSRDLIRHLDRYGRFRYFESSYHVRDLEMTKLDLAVWELRRYCTILNYSLQLPDGTKSRCWTSSWGRSRKATSSHACGTQESVGFWRRLSVERRACSEMLCYGKTPALGARRVGLFGRSITCNRQTRRFPYIRRYWMTCSSTYKCQKMRSVHIVPLKDQKPRE
jgi:HEPN domain-containing protein